jgi:CheY-like chemotaxis protein
MRQQRKRHAKRRVPLILLVEDDSDQREMYASLLSSHGFEVAQARDGARAVALAFELRPDLIVMDLSLPFLDGWEATGRLKRDPRTHRIPIVACTAHAFGPAVERALEVGCDAYVVKPFSLKNLLAEIRRMLARADGRAV